MGLTYADLLVKKSREGKLSADVKFLVDSGAGYSLGTGNLLNPKVVIPANVGIHLRCRVDSCPPPS